MKYTNLRAFEKHLESAYPEHRAPVYLILAKDYISSKKAIEPLQKSSDFGVKTLETDSVNADQLAAELQSFSLFEQNRLLILSRIHKGNDPIRRVLLDYLERPNEQLVLVLTGESLAANTKLYKAIEKVGVILNLSAASKPWEKQREMEDWLVKQSHSEGKPMEPRAAKSLIQHLGTDASSLEQELEKLICYVGDRPTITVQDIDAICPTVNQKTVWQLGEAIFSLNVAEAMSIAKALLKDQAPFILLLRQIRKQFQTDYQVFSLLATPDEIPRIFPYMKGRILQQHIDNARRYGVERFKKGLIEIDRTELEAKNSGIEDECLLELLIAKLCR
ncbi:MAG: hypothetical protein K940chlam3_00489 [Chlamydiae bacterium]|nr:hypothetical protein [Chlamydiota bacterium]